MRFPGRGGVSAPPPCRGMGRQCRTLPVVIRVGSVEDGAADADHEGTWLLGHTERIHFGEVWAADGELYVDAVIRVPCRHLEAEGGTERCAAHGFSRAAPGTRRPGPQPRRLGGDRFVLMDRRRMVTRTLPPAAPAGGRDLPVLDGGNPCAAARCQTSDHRIGAACCRDLQVEIMCTERQAGLEALVRARRRPWVTKVEREGEFSIAAEIISACDYLDPADGVSCTLHGRQRADGRTAKPTMCFAWPPKRQVLHRGCVFAGRAQKRRERERAAARKRAGHPPVHHAIHGDHPPATHHQ